MLKAKLLKEISFSGLHPVEVFPADINNDGEIEFVWLDSPGIFQSDVFDGTPNHVHFLNKRIFCLTATDEQGEVLWQVDKSCKIVHYVSHVADQMVYPFDLDLDGKLELLVLQKDGVKIYDASTGKLKQKKALSQDNYAIVKAAYRADGSARVLLKNAETAYKPYYYANPALILDANLEPIREPLVVEGSGHSPRNYDINGDGVDEWLIGYGAFDLDGNPLWMLDRHREESYDPNTQHVDQLTVGDVDSDGRPEIFYAGSDCVYLATSDGELLWERLMAHPQHGLIGNFSSNCKDQQIILHDAHPGAPLRAFSVNGEILWEKVVEDNWPLGKPQTVGNRPMHGPEAILKLPQGAPGGLDAIITDEWGWPQALGSGGERCFEIPCPSSARWPDAPPVNRRPDDYGYGYRAKVADFNNDGRCEILIHDRYHAWLFEPPLPSREELKPELHTSLLPFTGQPQKSSQTTFRHFKRGF